MHKSEKLSASFGLTAVCLAATLLAGCVGSASQSVRNILPGQLSADQPVLAQVNRSYAATSGAIGAEQDRYHNQSVGLGLISHPEAERYINQQLVKLKQASGIQGLPGQAYLFADTSYGTRSSADGNIYIPYVMLHELDSTDELAALLARELGHTIRNHNGIDLFDQLQQKGMMAAEVFGSMGGGDARAKDPTQERLAEILNAMSVADGFINPGWSRRQDQEADRLGLDLLISAGYNADAMFTLLDKMDRWNTRNKEQMSLRTSSIEQLLLASGLALTDLPFVESINNFLDQSFGQLGSVLNRFTSDGSTQGRQDGLRTYVRSHYAAAPSPALETRSWRNISQAQKTQRISRSLTQVVQARDAAVQGDLSNAEKLLRTAVNPDTNHQNFLRQSFHELRAAQNNQQGMRQNVNLAMRGQYPSFQIHVEQARLAGEANPASTRGLIRTFEQYGKPPAYYLPVVTMAEKSQLASEALRLHTECAAKSLGQGFACNTAGSAGAGTGVAETAYNALFKALAPK